MVSKPTGTCLQGLGPHGPHREVVRADAEAVSKPAPVLPKVAPAPESIPPVATAAVAVARSGHHFGGQGGPSEDGCGLLEGFAGCH